jgi:hypothetical protein
MLVRDSDKQPSPARLLEMLSDRFGAFEAIAYSTIKLARHEPEQELSMDLVVAEAVLYFGDDLRDAAKAATEWTGERGRRSRSAVRTTKRGSSIHEFIVHRVR